MIWFCLVTVVCCCCQNKTFQLKINLSDGFSRTRLQQLSMLAGMGWKCAMAVMTMCIRSFLPDCLLHWCLSGPYWLFNLLQMGYQYSHTFKRQHIRFLHKQLTKLPMCKMHIHWEDTWLLFHFDLMTLNIVFFKWAVPGLFFFICRLFFKQLAVNKCSIKVTEDWIWTRVLRYRKRLLCQLRHRNHCPTLNIVLRHQLGLHIKTWLDDDGFELRRLKV